jgi:hypothetical protein
VRRWTVEEMHETQTKPETKREKKRYTTPTARSVDFELRAAYTIRELADMAALPRGRVERLLESAGVEFDSAGRTRVVLLTEIREAMPRFWESVLTRLALQRDGGRAVE